MPFLSRYIEELAGTSLAGHTAAEAMGHWEQGLEEWERSSPVRLPLCDLRRAAGLDRLALTLLFAVGLVEEDPRFGLLAEALSGVPGQRRLPAAVLAGWTDFQRRDAVHRSLGLLRDATLVEPAGGERDDGLGLRPTTAVWEVVRGGVLGRAVPGVTLLEPDRLPSLEELVIPDDVRQRLHTLASLVTETAGDRAVRGVVVRGPESGGRKTVLKALARSLGRGVLLCEGLESPDDPRWRLVGPLATLFGAMPLVPLAPKVGETAVVPVITAYDGAVGVCLPARAAVGGPGIEPFAMLRLAIPDEPARREHWAAALGPYADGNVAELAAWRRMAGGAIRRVAALAVTEAVADGRAEVDRLDILRAADGVQARQLDALATRLPATGTWDELVVPPETAHELQLLAIRCRSREELDRVLPLPARPGTGVRALFVGPSGTGKTLAARVLSAALDRDVYRLDLSTVVDKYIGETEKNIDRALCAAEAMDTVLLIDEGDALLARRTDVGSSTDRYANLETNFVLQRLESHHGIVIVTTNAQQRIDEAFTRRLDVVIDFPWPRASERHKLWQTHLPPGSDLAPAFLDEVASRCELTGGQIRNVVLHACLLALRRNGARSTAAPVVCAEDLTEALRREYRKTGAVCPLRASAMVHG
ncbi:ATP-binding protein [Streptomyces sp. NPDC059916]|uniref:ATP-binding protein n=1 Tax=Streptomyces sp. NPDC059916 TaxID=3347001 RepID=UPI00367B75F3